MHPDRVATATGIAACIAVLLAVIAPYVLLTDPGTGLALYYGAGTFGIGGVVFLALVGIVVFAAGRQGRTDATLAAGIALVLGVVLAALAGAWAVAVDMEVVYSFTGDWMGWHRWLVLALSVLVPLSGGAYAASVLR